MKNMHKFLVNRGYNLCCDHVITYSIGNLPMIINVSVEKAVHEIKEKLKPEV
jgi:hypothetical protein